MLKFWLCFLSFFYTVNSFSTEEEKVKNECNVCFEEKNSSSLIESNKIFSCTCVDVHICKECILKLIVAKINLKKEKELTERNKKIKFLELIFGHIKEAIKEKNNNLQNFVKDIIKKKEKIEEEKKYEDIYQKLNAEEKLVYRAINKEEGKYGNTIFYIGEEKDPTEKLKFIKSFLSLLKQFNKNSHSSFTQDIEWSIRNNYNEKIKIEEIEKWEEKDVEIKVSCKLDTTELQKIKKEKVILINCPFCKYGIEKESAFFLKICGEEPSSQESSKKLSCIEYCGNICSDCF